MHNAQSVTEANSESPDFVNKIFSVIENSNKQQIRHKQARVNEVHEILYILYYKMLKKCR